MVWAESIGTSAYQGETNNKTKRGRKKRSEACRMQKGIGEEGRPILKLTMLIFQFFSFNSETHFQHRPNTGEGESHLKHSALRNDSGEDEILDHLLTCTISWLH